MTDSTGETPPGDEALTAETYVHSRNGRWEVEIVVIFADEVVRKIVGDYPSEREAQIAANWIKRSASRDIEAPPNE